ncbi:MAG TPA: hypothetical protein VE033_07370 [Acetobacteraceae bacterium]|jgi:hypothetical protein|nr:hypothetical protein [Acetobacteraceae bacterium]
MAGDERSYTGKYDTETKSARPGSVGPHHARDKQEDPSNPGIRPEEGYGAEIARNNAATEEERGRSGGQVVAPQPKGETADESGGTEDLLKKSGPARDAPPMTGTVSE